jgi:hypothetical protein
MSENATVHRVVDTDSTARYGFDGLALVGDLGEEKA